MLDAPSHATFDTSTHSAPFKPALSQKATIAEPKEEFSPPSQSLDFRSPFHKKMAEKAESSIAALAEQYEKAYVAPESYQPPMMDSDGIEIKKPRGPNAILGMFSGKLDVLADCYGFGIDGVKGDERKEAINKQVLKYVQHAVVQLEAGAAKDLKAIAEQKKKDSSLHFTR